MSESPSSPLRAADAIARRLASRGIDTCFSVTGGGSMHINDAFATQTSLRVWYLHHEQACAMAAEGFARVSGRPAVVNVTSGPGVLNALNGVFGAYTDSIPMVVVSGQVRQSTMAETYGLTSLRQLGDQELRTGSVVADLVKEFWHVSHVDDCVRVADAAYDAAVSGRPGPTWIEIPVDVQGLPIPAEVESSLALRAPIYADAQEFTNEQKQADALAQLLMSAKRPLILAGTGVRLSNTQDALVRIAERARVPVATAWTHDVFPNQHPLYAGRPGTIGTRAGNFVLQACDLLIVLGSRLNIRQISYNYEAFAPDATIVWVDIDPLELDKPFVSPDYPIVADLRTFLPRLEVALRQQQFGSRDGWLSWCSDVRSSYEPAWRDYIENAAGINPYHLVMSLSDSIDPDSIVVCGNASACIIPFQVHKVRPGGRLISNSGSASMGYDLPAAIGASIAEPDRSVVCLAGDGSLMMNLQELQTLATLTSNILVVVLDNGGYLSIRQTQANFFGHEAGCSPTSGLTFPDFEAVCRSFGLPAVTLTTQMNWQEVLRESILDSGPRVVVVKVDPSQEFEPRIRSRMVGGVITTPSLDDMYPHLPDEVLAEVRDAGIRAEGP